MDCKLESVNNIASTSGIPLKVPVPVTSNGTDASLKDSSPPTFTRIFTPPYSMSVQDGGIDMDFEDG